jgi:hypothetical protein
LAIQIMQVKVLKIKIRAGGMAQVVECLPSKMG